MFSIETIGLTKKYGKLTAVNGLDLQVNKGEIFGFLGPNGAGKTTTVRMLTGLTKPTSGQVLVNGFHMIKQPVAAKKQIGVVSQYNNVDVDLTSVENLRLHGLLHSMDKSKREERILELLHFAHLGKRKDDMVRTFSGGMKRRLMIIRALLHTPQILFMDEPTVGLDPQTRKNIWDLIRQIRDSGCTIFMTTHYIEEAENLCDRVAIIDLGKLIALDVPAHLTRGLGPYTLEYIEAGKSTCEFYKTTEQAYEIAHSRETQMQEFNIRSTNLEDLFIHLTGRSVRE